MFYNTLNNLNQNNYNLELDLSKVQLKDKITSLEVGKNYYIKGLTGSGKTTIAIHLAKKFIEKLTKITGLEKANQGVYFIKFFKLIKLLQSYDKEDRREIEKLANARFLIIDDFGVGYGKEYSLVELEDFFDERMGMGDDAVTIITTNINFELEENKDLKRAFARILSRIGAMCTHQGIIELEQKDKRFNKSEHISFNFNKIQKKEDETKLNFRVYKRIFTLDEYKDNEDLLSFEKKIKHAISTCDEIILKQDLIKYLVDKHGYEEISKVTDYSIDELKQAINIKNNYLIYD